MSIHRFVEPDPRHAAEACSHQIVSHLETALLAQESATFAISGGSSPKLVFDALVKARFDWSRVHLFWVDERCVHPMNDQSNFRLADRALVIPARIPRRQVHRVYGELAPDRAAERYAEDIRDFFRLPPGEVPHFDLIHLGMGPDGHTASLFPGDPHIDNREALTAAVYNDHLAQYRVTMLPLLLLNAKHTVIYSTGADKAEAVRAAIEDEYEPRRVPIHLARHGRNVSWFLDQPAAARLS